MTLRVVIDPNVLVAALLSPNGSPALVVRQGVNGQYIVVASPHLATEFASVARREKFQPTITERNVAAVETWLRSGAEMHEVAEEIPAATRDPNDDYLVALARTAEADLIVSGDRDLLDTRLDDVKVVSPRDFIDRPDEDPPAAE